MDSTTLDEAIRAGDEARVAQVLASRRELASEPGPGGMSPLMQAAYHRRPGVVREILSIRPPETVFEAAAVGAAEQLGALLAENPDATHARHLDGFTALHLASFFGHAACVGLLLEAGAEPAVTADNPTRVQPLHSAVAARDASCVKALLDAGAGPDARQQGGYTPLMAAARHGDIEIVRALLASGADRTARADDGRDAETLARDADQDEAAELLRAAP